MKTDTPESMQGRTLMENKDVNKQCLSVYIGSKMTTNLRGGRF
jgi:hypothetical protein